MKLLICLILNVSTDSIAHPIKGLHDSGAQISDIHPNFIKDILPHLSSEIKVKLKGCIGDPIETDLISLFIKLSESNDNGVSVVMAMSKKVNIGLILTDPVAQSLISLSHQYADDTSNNTLPEVFTDFVTNTYTSESDLNADKTSSTDILDCNTRTAKELIAKQLSDSSLSTCWALAYRNKGNYFIKDRILYKDVIAG